MIHPSYPHTNPCSNANLILIPTQILEFSHVRNPLLAQVYEQYSFNVIPKIGGLVAGDSASYQVSGEVVVKCQVRMQILHVLFHSPCSTYITNLTLTYILIFV